MIEQRYRFFGGSARYCLTLASNAVLKERQRIGAKSFEIKTVQDLKSLLSLETPSAGLSHALFHFRPERAGKFSLPIMFNYFFASREISTIVYDAVLETLEANRIELMIWFRKKSGCAVMLGWLFENSVHRQLLNGKDLHLSCLRTSLPVLVQIPKDVYHPVRNDNNTAIDGYWYQTTSKGAPQLYLFQITRNLNHPVTQYGLKSNLLALGISSPNQAKNMELILVFVIPKDLEGFRTQRIKRDECPKRDDHLILLRNIGPSTASKLEAKGLRTIGDLVTESETQGNQLTCGVKNAIQAFTNHEQELLEWDFLIDIPQYVVRMDD